MIIISFERVYFSCIFIFCRIRLTYVAGNAHTIAGVSEMESQLKSRRL